MAAKTHYNKGTWIQQNAGKPESFTFKHNEQRCGGRGKERNMEGCTDERRSAAGEEEPDRPF